jgi:hypothetical protein
MEAKRLIKIRKRIRVHSWLKFFFLNSIALIAQAG